MQQVRDSQYLRKKVCLLGAFAVGKTSLVSRFVKGIYSDKYHTTVGVKVDQKSVVVGPTEISLAVWDLAGEDEFQKVNMAYMQGARGYLLVADGTRAETMEIARLLRERAESTVGKVPFVLVLNKSDLTTEWEIEEASIKHLQSQGWSIIRSSAKTGEGVDEAFSKLVQQMLGDK